MKVPNNNFIQIMDVEIRYWNKISNRKDYPVLFLHGLNGFIEHWIQNFMFIGESYSVYAIDLPGAGFSGNIETLDYSLENIGKYIEGFLKALNLDKVSIIAHSFGGAVALHFAHIYPEAVYKLILVDSMGFSNEIIYTAKLASIPGIGEFLTLPLFDPLSERINKYAYKPELLDQELLAFLKQISSRINKKREYLSMLRHVCSFRGISPDILIDNIYNLFFLENIPVSLVWGRDDPILPVKHIARAYKVSPHAEINILEQCGHVPQFEKPDEFNDIVLKFLSL